MGQTGQGRRGLRVRLAVVVASALAIATASPAGASTIYNNLPLSPELFWSAASVNADCGECGGSGPLANSFSTGSSSVVFNQLVLRLATFYTESDGAVTVDLLSDDDTQPGTFVANLGTVADNTLPYYYDPDFMPAYADVVLSSFAIPLSPNTRYWIRLTDAGNDEASTRTVWWQWYQEGKPVDLACCSGVADEYWATTGFKIETVITEWNVTPNSDPQSFQMLVNGASAAAVPEPGTLALLATGVALGFGARRRSAR